MSHFTVLVVGDDYEGQLAPFHEFECTGEDDQYVQDVDQTAEASAEFEKYTKKCFRSPEGKLVDRYEPQFYRDPTPEELKLRGAHPFDRNDQGLSWSSKDWGDGLGYREKVRFVPEGWTEVEVPISEFQTFAEWIDDYYGHPVVPFGKQPNLEKTHKYGYTIVDENGDVVKTINRTNPNKKWDWFQVGGRWNGFFKLKPTASGIVALGEPGINKMDKGYEPPTEDRADSTTKGNIDMEGMREDAATTAVEQYDLFAAVTAGLPPITSWEAMLVKYGVKEGTVAQVPGGVQAARTEYHEQPAIKALAQNEATRWFDASDFVFDGNDEVSARSAYIQNARNRIFSTYAFVKDSKWYGKGEMGWFGMSHNEVSEDEWLAKFNQMIDELPDDTLLTVVDCHI